LERETHCEHCQGQRKLKTVGWQKGNRLCFTRNDPFDRSSPIQLVISKRIESKEFMEGIRGFEVPSDAIAVWYLGQNGLL